MTRRRMHFDIVVIGGGYSGTFAAIAAARELQRLGLGERTVALIQERPVLGGCASSEIRVPPIGSGRHPWGFETGLIHEYMLEERARNHTRWEYGTANSVADLVLWEMVEREPNLTLILNTTVRDVVMGAPGADGRPAIAAVLGSQLGTEKELDISGRYFIDATGDGTVGFKAGAEYRIGREAAAEFGESFAPETADTACMGSTLLFKAVDTGAPAPFAPPPYAPLYPDEESLCGRPLADFRSGYWWIEVGYPFHTIDENEQIRNELLRHVLGVWDHLKNHNPRFKEQARNWALDWFGWVPGKREARRLMGDHVLTEGDIRRTELFPDRIAYGGHFLDLHTMGGILAKDQPGNPVDVDPDLWDRMRVSPFSIPFRSLYSRNIENLMMAGRDLSATHVAMGATRVMLTNAVIGQGVGTAAAYCLRRGCSPRELTGSAIGDVQQSTIEDERQPAIGDERQSAIEDVQQSLLRQGCYLPMLSNRDPNDLARRAQIEVSSAAPLIVEPQMAADGGAFVHPQRRRSMAHELGVIFPVTADRVETVWIWLESESPAAVTVHAGIRRIEHIWDANNSHDDLGTAAAAVEAGHRGWVPLHFAAAVEPGRLYWIHTSPASGLYWRYETELPTGVVSLWRRTGNGRWLYANEGYRQSFQSYCFRVEPEPSPYGGANLVSGVTRPEQWTHSWVSDPSRPLPQWAELRWDRPVRLNRIELTFDTNLSETNEQALPFSRQSRCVKDYEVLAEIDGEWVCLCRVEGNYQRQRAHAVETVEASALRIVVTATNGDPSARIYEVRVYNE